MPPIVRGLRKDFQKIYICQSSADPLHTRFYFLLLQNKTKIRHQIYSIVIFVFPPKEIAIISSISGIFLTFHKLPLNALVMAIV